MVSTKMRLVWIAVLLAITIAGFTAGRRFEEHSVAARLHPNSKGAALRQQPVDLEVPSYRELRVADVIALPFSEFYEALRSAPADARQKWAAELEKMPPGPRRAAAVSGFYKLLIQFDPAMAIKAIREIEDEGAQRLAVEAAVNAAPGFALPDLVAFTNELPTPDRGHSRDYLSDLIVEWIAIDPPAVARFLDDHPDKEEGLLPEALVSTWAALDPKAAKEWVEKNRNLERASEIRREFINGWYENDRAAAVSYVLGHIDGAEGDVSGGDILRMLYYDSKDEARKFIKDLPDDQKRQSVFHAAFKYAVVGEAEVTGEPRWSPQALRDWMVEFPPAYWKESLSWTFEWTRRPAREILSWIEQQPAAIRSAVAAEYVPTHDMSTADTIIPVLELADPQLRDELLIALFRNAGGDRGVLQEQLAAAAISAEEKDHLFRLMAQVDAENTAGPTP
jgi:hypothetical protein